MGGGGGGRGGLSDTTRGSNMTGKPAPVTPKPNTHYVPPGTEVDEQGNPVDGVAAPLGYDPSRENDPFGIGGLETTDPNKAVEQFQYLSGSAANALAQGGYDPARADRYYQESIQPIESDFYKQAGSTAAFLARQGLGSSGINTGVSTSLTNNKDALESQARRSSIGMSEEARRREILDAFSTSAMGLQPMLQNKGIDVGLRIAQMQYELAMRQLANQESAGVGSLLGTGLGALATYGIMTSDERVKENISDGPPGDWKTFDFKEGYGPPGRHVGVIAQEIEDEYPDCVVTLEDGVKRVNYHRLAIRRGEK